MRQLAAEELFKTFVSNLGVSTLGFGSLSHGISPLTKLWGPKPKFTNTTPKVAN